MVEKNYFATLGLEQERYIIGERRARYVNGKKQMKYINGNITINHDALKQDAEEAYHEITGNEEYNPTENPELHQRLNTAKDIFSSKNLIVVYARMVISPYPEIVTLAETISVQELQGIHDNTMEALSVTTGEDSLELSLNQQINQLRTANTLDGAIYSYNEKMSQGKPQETQQQAMPLKQNPSDVHSSTTSKPKSQKHTQDNSQTQDNSKGFVYSLSRIMHQRSLLAKILITILLVGFPPFGIMYLISLYITNNITDNIKQQDSDAQSQSAELQPFTPLAQITDKALQTQSPEQHPTLSQPIQSHHDPVDSELKDASQEAEYHQPNSYIANALQHEHTDPSKKL